MQDFPVVIVGGGLVGTATALALAREGIAVALLEASPPPQSAMEGPPGLRVAAINRRSRRFLHGLDAWPEDSPRLGAFHHVAVWEQGVRDRVTFSAKRGDAEPLGHIVENDLLLQRLFATLRAASNVDLITPATPRALDLDDGLPLLTLEDGRTLRAPLVVGADGARSLVREAAGVEWYARDYGQHALVATVRLATGAPDMTWQRFTATGPQALLPLSGGHASLVWYHRPQEVARLHALDADALRVELMEAFPAELGQIEAVVEHASFPIRRGHAARYALGGAVLVGDAAHVIHPLAGQGLNLGMRDAEALARLAAAAHRRGRALATPAVLARYEAQRRPDNLAMLMAVGAVHRVFTSRLPGSSGLRRLGLRAAQRSGPLKHIVRDYACGSL